MEKFAVMTVLFHLILSPEGQELDICGTVNDDMSKDQLDCRQSNYFICRFGE